MERNLIDEQWKEIMESDPFSDEARFTLASGNEFTVFGIFYSGSYKEDSAVPYSNKHWERKEWFQISPLSLPDEVVDYATDLRNAEVEIGERGTFVVHEVKGEKSGMLTIWLMRKEYCDV